jgi:hypothetical protein
MKRLLAPATTKPTVDPTLTCVKKNPEIQNTSGMLEVKRDKWLPP